MRGEKRKEAFTTAISFLFSLAFSIIYRTSAETNHIDRLEGDQTFIKIHRLRIDW